MRKETSDAHFTTSRYDSYEIIQHALVKITQWFYKTKPFYLDHSNLFHIHIQLLHNH